MVKYLHSMIRVTDPMRQVAFFRLIRLREVRRFDVAGLGSFHADHFSPPPGQEGLAEIRTDL